MSGMWVENRWKRGWNGWKMVLLPSTRSGLSSAVLGRLSACQDRAECSIWHRAVFDDISKPSLPLGVMLSRGPTYVENLCVWEARTIGGYQRLAVGLADSMSFGFSGFHLL